MISLDFFFLIFFEFLFDFLFLFFLFFLFFDFLLLISNLPLIIRFLERARMEQVDYSEMFFVEVFYWVCQLILNINIGVYGQDNNIATIR